MRAFDQQVELPLRSGVDENIPQRFIRYGPQEDWVVSGFFPYQKDETDVNFWITHPPLAFVRDIVGEEKFGRCVEAIRAGTATMCLINGRKDFCYEMRITKTGYSVMRIYPHCFRKQFEEVDFELSNAEIYPAPGQFIPEP